LFGVILAIYDGITERKRTRQREAEEREGQIQRYQEEIDDFRGWREKEASYRIVGNIRRLNQLGISEINLEDCFLVGANLKSANLAGAKMRKANLEGANLQRVNLENANLNGAVLHDTNLQGANLKGANLKGANFVEGQSLIRSISLMKSQLDKADLRGVTLDQTRLEGVNLAGAMFEEVHRQVLVRMGAEIKHTVFQPGNSRRATQRRGRETRVSIREHAPREVSPSPEPPEVSDDAQKEES
ncbi:MAG: pentapeptide repeat-containing protein, partial [Bacteroidota bacterium]